MGLKLPNLSRKVLVCMLCHEPLAGILPNLHVYIIGVHHRMVWVVGGTSVFSEITVIFHFVMVLQNA